jgi:prepilin-type N-terminal cleavage/methylation domain-containing protein
VVDGSAGSATPPTGLIVLVTMWIECWHKERDFGSMLVGRRFHKMKKSKVQCLKYNVSPRAGFTLIELMMVVLVILMLSGLLFKLGSIIKDRSERAKTMADLANIEHALNEYFAEYGTYPPTQDTAYKYEDTSLQPPSMLDPNFTNFVAYSYGLVAYLYKRGDLTQHPNSRNPDWNPDTDRDEAAKDRWAHYLADVSRSSSDSPQSNVVGGITHVYTNKSTTIKDAWGGEYKYESRPPYLSYRLWSSNLD